MSAVIYLCNEAEYVTGFLTLLTQHLSERFAQYELIFVDDASCDGSLDNVRHFLKELKEEPPATIVHLSVKRGLESAMNAGTDIAVGDFVYEFDTMQTPWPPEMIGRAYDTCLSGNDIVSVSPAKNRNAGVSFFYRLFNHASHSRYALRTDVFRLLSRRAINRVRSINIQLKYRKASYATCGLKLKTLVYTGQAPKLNQPHRFSHAVDALILYTDLASRATFAVACIMLACMVVALVYTLSVFFGSSIHPTPGWTTTMLLLTGGFFGIFLVLSIVLKYLSLLIDLTFRRPVYLVESVEKLS